MNKVESSRASDGESKKEKKELKKRIKFLYVDSENNKKKEREKKRCVTQVC